MPPLNVFSNTEKTIPQLQTDTEELARNLGLTLAEYLGQICDEPPTAPLLAYKYQYGKPLVRPEEVQHLPTKMRRLHEWYLQASQEGTSWLIVGFRDEYYYSGDDELIIEFDKMFQLYNQSAIDKTIVSFYCL